MNIDFEELHVFDNSKSKYVPREMYEQAQAESDRRLELLKEMDDRCAFCPWCMNHRISTVGEKIHNDDCKLAKELADA